MFWIMLHHTGTGMTFGYISANSEYQVREWNKDLWFWMTSQGSMAVDTFFTIGGFLTAYLIFGKFDRLRNLKLRSSNGENLSEFYYFVEVLSAIALRWLRFIPTILGLLCFMWMINLMPMSQSYGASYWTGLRDGCVHPDTAPYSAWGLLSFQSIWYGTSDRCAGWLWYVEVDFWLYIFAVFVVFCISSPKKSMTWLNKQFCRSK